MSDVADRLDLATGSFENTGLGWNAAWFFVCWIADLRRVARWER